MVNFPKNKCFLDDDSCLRKRDEKSASKHHETKLDKDDHYYIEEHYDDRT